MEKQDLQADVIVPALQSLITGAFVTLVVGTVAGALVAWGGRTWGAGQIFAASFTVGFIAAAVAWFNLMGDRRPMPPIVEEAEPATVMHKVEFVAQHPGGALIRYADLPEGVDGQTMRKIARAVDRPGGAFSRPWLCRRKRILTQNQYHDLRASWLRAGFLVALPGNRTELTAAGRAVLDSFKD